MLDKAVVRRKGGSGRGDSDVPQGRGRVPGPRSLSILFQNRRREDPRQSEGCSRWQIHFNCSMTVPSEIVGRATPVLLAFLAIHSRAARVLSSAPALSW